MIDCQQTISFQVKIYLLCNTSEPNDTTPKKLPLLRSNIPPPDQELNGLLGAMILVILVVGLVGYISEILFPCLNQHSKPLPKQSLFSNHQGGHHNKHYVRTVLLIHSDVSFQQ